MKYNDIINAEFLNRNNRFVAEVLVSGKSETVHIKNTGRCRELLIPGTKVYIEDFGERMGKRKLSFDLICVQKNDLLINIDSQAPNKVVHEGLLNKSIILPNLGNIEYVKAETKFGNSRFDFYVKDDCGNEAFIEVKGVTLEHNGKCFFPDAPTERGTKHLNELVSAKKHGYNVYLIFVVQMNGIKSISPNDDTDSNFGKALRKAAAEGVIIKAYECMVSPDTLEIEKEISVVL